VRRHPVLKFTQLQAGVDFAAPPGTPILAAGAGRVVEAGPNGSYGRWVKISHDGGLATYAHMSRIAPGVRAQRACAAGPSNRLRRQQRPVDQSAPAFRAASQRATRGPPQHGGHGAAHQPRRRGPWVKQGLVARGIPADRLQLGAMGTSFPVDPNATLPENNRRVVITWR
jgi:hypothetical protein